MNGQTLVALAPSATTANQRWSQDESRVGFQLLLKMGWDKDKGLGANQQGSTTVISAKKKTERAGIGAEKDVASNNWMLPSASVASDFHNVLASLTPIGECPQVVVPSQKKGKSTDCRDEKEARVSQSRQSHHGTKSQSYFARKAKGKNVKAYSAEHLREIFGGAPGVGSSCLSLETASIAAPVAPDLDFTMDLKVAESKHKGKKKDKRQKESKSPKKDDTTKEGRVSKKSKSSSKSKRSEDRKSEQPERKSKSKSKKTKTQD